MGNCEILQRARQSLEVIENLTKHMKEQLIRAEQGKKLQYFDRKD